MKVTDLAKQLGVTTDTVRFYTRKGLLQPHKNPGNGYRDYTASDSKRLRFILSARQLGFSVDDITHLLHQADAGKTPCPLARTLIEQKLDDLEKRFADTARLLQRMRSAAADWRQLPDKEPTGHMICHLIENTNPTGECDE